MLAPTAERKVKMKVKKIVAFVMAFMLIVGALTLSAVAKSTALHPWCGTRCDMTETPSTYSVYYSTSCSHGYSGTDGYIRGTATFYCTKCRIFFTEDAYGTRCNVTGNVTW